jgi:hypothetical protein
VKRGSKKKQAQKKEIGDTQINNGERKELRKGTEKES